LPGRTNRDDVDVEVAQAIERARMQPRTRAANAHAESAGAEIEIARIIERARRAHAQADGTVTEAAASTAADREIEQVLERARARRAQMRTHTVSVRVRLQPSAPMLPNSKPKLDSVRNVTRTIRGIIGSLVILDSDEEDDGYVDDASECLICMEDLTPENARELKICGHRLHEKCLRKWINSEDYRGREKKVRTCPVCRADVDGKN
jgi:hypothetical protein